MHIALKTVIGNSAKWVELDLHEGENFSIGRADCELVVPDDKVSRRHLRLVVKNNQLVAEDLKSSNGTFHAGKRITAIALRENDSLKIGQHTLIFEKIGSEAARPAAPERPREPAPAPIAAARRGFPFLKDGRPDVDGLVSFYRGALSGFRTFWTDTAFEGVPLEDSLIVLAAGGALCGALIFLPLLLHFGGGPKFFVGGTLAMTIAALAGGAISAGGFVLLKGFLKARGNFEAYLSYCAYAMVLAIPVTLITGLLGRFGGSPLSMAFSFYVMWGFTRAFGASLPRLVAVYLVFSVIGMMGAAGVAMRFLGPALM